MARVFLGAVLMLMMSNPVAAREMAGVDIEDQVSMADGTVLQFNGAGIRSKFVFKIYLAMLYLENPSNDRDQVISDPGAKRLIMHFLYSEVGKDVLVEAWNAGFSGNGTAGQLASLSTEIERFNAMFDTVKKGDRIVLDYVPGTGTVVTVGSVEKGTIPGKEFNELLLSIWLGDKPVGEKLRDALLGK
jgi:hypothetical protein